LGQRSNNAERRSPHDEAHRCALGVRLDVTAAADGHELAGGDIVDVGVTGCQDLDAAVLVRVLKLQDDHVLQLLHADDATREGHVIGNGRKNRFLRLVDHSMRQAGDGRSLHPGTSA
jgi:hypothetical protein